MRWGWGIFLLLSLGCSNRSAALQDSVDNYAKALRRGDQDIAMSYMSPEKREDIVKALKLERLDKDLLISQVDVKSINADDKLESAVVTILLEYYNQFSAGLTVTKSVSLWKYDEKLDGWIIDSTTPVK